MGLVEPDVLRASFAQMWGWASGQSVGIEDDSDCKHKDPVFVASRTAGSTETPQPSSLATWRGR
jgi:hypothetical protein